MDVEYTIRRLEQKDIPSTALLHQDCFPKGGKGVEGSIKWITSNFNSFPMNTYYVADSGSEILGYALWMEKGGFREKAVVELRELGVLNQYRGNGIGTRLIKESLIDFIDTNLKSEGRVLDVVEICVHNDNQAQELYKKALGAKKVTVIPSFYGEGKDEAVMLARGFD